MVAEEAEMGRRKLEFNAECVSCGKGFRSWACIRCTECRKGMRGKRKGYGKPVTHVSEDFVKKGVDTATR
uniref:Uncharacterized protein n=1 Tax=viral metagenome TaxID=1070528 RepID=A0A6M3IG82_9ZZZZ